MSVGDDWRAEWALEPTVPFVRLGDEQKDEFRRRLLEFMRRQHDCGYSGRTLIYPTVERTSVRVEELILNPPDNRERARFQIVNLDGGLWMRIVGRGTPHDADLEAWNDAVQDALTRLGERTLMRWSAVLAQDPAGSHGCLRLGAVAEVGDLSFEPLDGTLLHDHLTATPGGGVMAVPYSTALIKVRGAVACYAWDEDGNADTVQRLRIVTALISLAWDTCWYLRDGPLSPPEVRWADAPGPVSGYTYRWRTAHEDAGPLSISSMTPQLIPERLPNAERKAVSLPWLRRALLMHHEALSLQRQHPSVALVAFISAIETIAANDRDPVRLAQRRHAKRDAERFAVAIAGVVSDEQADHLVDAYTHRSRTVHSSELHGTELDYGGWGRMSLYLPTTTLQFEAGTVLAAKEASRTLLRRMLGLAS